MFEYTHKLASSVVKDLDAETTTNFFLNVCSISGILENKVGKGAELIVPFYQMLDME